MWFTRTKAEEPSAAAADLARIALRVETLETIPRPTPDVTSLREGYDMVRTAVAGLTERANQATAELNDLREAHKDLVLAVAEGIERTERAERRVKAVVKRARKELADSGLTDPALEAEDRELSPVDEERGENGGLQPVRGAVAPAREEPSSVRGVPLATMRRMRGF